MLVAEEKFLPSGKMQTVGEPLFLIICKKQARELFILVLSVPSAIRVCQKCFF